MQTVFWQSFTHSISGFNITVGLLGPLLLLHFIFALLINILVAFASAAVCVGYYYITVLSFDHNSVHQAFFCFNKARSKTHQSEGAEKNQWRQWRRVIALPL